MKIIEQPQFTKRYEAVSQEKAGGATYTPRLLADFVARQIVETAGGLSGIRVIRILDPAVGDGELLLSLIRHLAKHPKVTIEAYGFDTDTKALNIASSRLSQEFPGVTLHFQPESFLDFVLERTGLRLSSRGDIGDDFDLIIANPPYVRTQIMGAVEAQRLAEQFGLSGRVDLYFAFVLGMAQVLKPKGIAGIIVSNRFMTTKSGAPVRQAILERFNLRHVWDLGDTKLFDAAVLPAVLLAEGRNGHKVETPAFSSIYETADRAEAVAADPIDALAAEGVVQLADGRRVRVHHGLLNSSGVPDGIWRVATDTAEEWLGIVAAHTWGTFGDIGNIRVGVKTCADKVFIRSDWQDMPEETRPELLRSLITHHGARRYKAAVPTKVRQILYPHTVTQSRRHPVDLAKYPKSAAYLEEHRSVLEGRKYVIEAGREWFEIWVPQDPKAWDQLKLVFRDIAEEPTFWIDQEGAVVNGDCYWLICRDEAQSDLLWLAAAVGNSKFIERFYDYSFHNKLYSGRRRFITQYVEKFPLPDPKSALAKSIISKAKEIYDCIPSAKADKLQLELDAMIWKAFGLVVEEVVR
jgi:hypothetical protein